MNKENFEELRIMAENHLNAAGGHIENLNRADLENIAHELAVYKVELEIQNEELRRTRIAAEEARDRYLDLFDNAPIGYFSLDEQNRIVEVNSAGCLLFQTTKDNLFGKSFTKFIRPEESDSFYLFRKKLMKSEKRVTYELQMQTNDGTPFFAQIESLKVGKEGFRMAVIDISIRRKAEKMLATQKVALELAYKDLEDFSASISHDLRAPLRAMCSFSEIVLIDYGDILDETGKGLLNRIVEASQVMTHLTVDIMKLSYISRTALVRERVDLSKIAQTILLQLKEAQPERQAEVIIAPHLNADGDPNLLEIGLRNILENAWKYSGNSALTRIEFGMMDQKTEQNSEKVYFIRDNGVGFDMQYKDQLYQPFHRLHSNKEFPGNGIGLAISLRVIQRHGGRIWAEAEVGKGATFYFTLE